MTDALRLAIYSDAAEWGGAEQSLSMLLRALSPHVSVALLATNVDVLRRLQRSRPTATASLAPGIRNKGDILRIWKTRQAIVAQSPDLFHANLNSLWSCQYALAAALSIPGLKVLAVEHCAMPSTSFMSRYLKYQTCARLDAYITVGERVARELEVLVGLPRGAVKAIHNGVSAPSRGRPPVRVGRSPVVGTIARLDRLKGTDLLVRAIAQLDDVRLVIVGDGDYRPELERLVANLGVGSRVHFTGWLDDPSAYLESFDIFALPSRLEAFPLTILDAMFAGIPVVASDVGSISEAVVEGETGTLIPTEDAAGLVVALRRLLGDEELRRRMGGAGRRRAEARFSADGMVRSYEELYEGLRSCPPPKRRVKWLPRPVPAHLDGSGVAQRRVHAGRRRRRRRRQDP